MHKVLITGASGLLGRSLVKEFTRANWQVLGLAYSRAGGSLKKVDIRDCEAIKVTIQDYKPHVVIHAAAERRPDIVEKQQDETKKLNVEATSTIAALCGETGAYLIYISSDYVFDGTAPPYKPGDQPNPLNKYGHSKLDGEMAVQAHKEASYAILRIPVLYGEVEYVGESAVTVLLQALLDTSKPGVMDHYQIRHPTHVQDIAFVCRQMSDMYLKNPSAVCGVFHWSNPEDMTKFTMASIMAEIYGLPAGHLVANRDPPSGAPRPYDCTFDCSALTELGIGQITVYKDAIGKCIEPYVIKS